MTIYTQTYWTWYQYLSNIKVYNLNNTTLSEVNPTVDDYLVVFQPYTQELRQRVFDVIDKFDYSKRVLVHYEGRYRRPHGFKLRYQQRFGKIYTYNSTDIDCDTVKYMPIPLWITESDCLPTGNRKKLICSVLTNYARDGEPRGIIIEKFKALGMDVYGKNDIPVPGDVVPQSFPYRNRYKSKVDLMSDYIFSFVTENQLDLGHVTEKIFDAIAAGCIPIYLGPIDICKFVTKSCFINYRDFWSEVDIINYIKSMNSEKIKEYQLMITQYQKKLIGMRTYESCMRFLCKDLGFDCEAPYYNDIINLSKILSTPIGG